MACPPPQMMVTPFKSHDSCARKATAGETSSGRIAFMNGLSNISAGWSKCRSEDLGRRHAGVPPRRHKVHADAVPATVERQRSAEGEDPPFAPL